MAAYGLSMTFVERTYIYIASRRTNVFLQLTLFLRIFLEYSSDNQLAAPLDQSIKSRANGKYIFRSSKDEWFVSLRKHLSELKSALDGHNDSIRGKSPLNHDMKL